MTISVIDNEDLGYGSTAVLPRLSFSYTVGERVAVLGRSGSGKTTLLTAICRRLQGRKACVSLVPQDHALVPQLSVFHNVYMGRLESQSVVCNLINLLVPTKAQIARVKPYVQSVGLQDFLDIPVDQLSGGEKQRVALARAMFRGGDILLGDEPVSSVDETQAADLLSQLQNSFATAILALHDVGMAQRFATRVVGIKNGQITIDAAAGTVQPSHLERLYADD